MGEISPIHWLIVLCFLIIPYWLPTIIGWKKRNRTAIFALNFFAGWTFVGWVVAMVWALTKDPQTAA